jgi:hypothetical protein
MERIIRAESAAMRVTLATLIADIRGPTVPNPPVQVKVGTRRMIADRGGSE